MDSTILAIVIVGGSAVLAVVGLLLVRKCFDVESFRSQHEVAGYMLSILGTLYAVVLGFMVVDVSNHVQEERVNLGSEINSLMNIHRLSEGLSTPSREAIQIACLQYARAVYTEEWDLMPKGKLSASAYKWMKVLWERIRDASPANEKQQSFYNELLQSYESMSASRRIRLVTAVSGVSPVLWAVLVFGAIATISFTYFFTLEKLSSQVTMTVVVAVTLALNIYLVIINSSPFTGTFKIRSAPFVAAARIMQQNGYQPPDLHDLR